MPLVRFHSQSWEVMLFTLVSLLALGLNAESTWMLKRWWFDLMIKFHVNRASSFSIMLLTDQQTDRQTSWKPPWLLGKGNTIQSWSWNIHHRPTSWFHFDHLPIMVECREWQSFTYSSVDNCAGSQNISTFCELLRKAVRKRRSSTQPQEVFLYNWLSCLVCVPL